MINEKNLKIENLSTVNVFEKLYDSIQEGTALFTDAPIWDSTQKVIVAKGAAQIFKGKEDRVQKGTFVNSRGYIFKWLQLMHEKVNSDVLIFENTADFWKARLSKRFRGQFL